MATALHDFLRYQVLFTVLIDADTYGSTVDVTQDVDITDSIRDISSITNEIDNGDYDIGVFTFGAITLTAKNHERKFSPAEDWRSIFPYKRDKTKVHIKFFDKAGNSVFSFRGLINDDATRAEITGNDVKFKVLSLDSILRQVQVTGGQVSSGMLFSEAIKSILNVPEITTVINYSASDVNVDLDLAIDDGDYFTDSSSKDALHELLLASNSILYIDKSDNLYVKPRTESANIFYFYGRHDPYGRENITKISSYNTGVQRAFSSIKINETVKTSAAYVDLYGFRQKEITLSFITNTVTEALIGDNILLQFQSPKEELEIEVRTEDSDSIELLDLVSVSMPYRLSPPEGLEKVSQYGVAQYGTDKYNRTYGSYRIDPTVKWKVIGITENPKKFTRTLKLRVSGVTFGDGVF
jgi:hypothetical protein